MITLTLLLKEITFEQMHWSLGLKQFEHGVMLLPLVNSKILWGSLAAGHSYISPKFSENLLKTNILRLVQWI